MPDGRRRPWLAVDPNFYTHPVVRKLFVQFGPNAVIVFDAYLRACKLAFVEGQITYANADQFISIIGLPPDFELTDAHGDKWCLDDLWKLLSNHNLVSRVRRDSRVTVVASRWDSWQKRRSRPRNTDAKRRTTATETVTETPLPLDDAAGGLPEGLWQRVAEKKYAMQKPGAVRDPARWRASVAASAERDQATQARRWLTEFDVSLDQLATALADDKVPGSWGPYRRRGS